MHETITGLALVVALACLGLTYGLAAFLGMFWRLSMWARTNQLPPTPGQVWNQNGARLFITGVTGSGKDTLIRIRSYAYKERNEWNESLSTWNERVRANHLYLMTKESEKFTKVLSKESVQ
jgi:hypothetical protein